MTIAINQPAKMKAYFLLIVTNAFFAFQFIPRLSLGILREDLMDKFSLSATEFGLLSGYYYLGYSFMQIPIGFMLDKYSFRLVTSFSVLICSLGMAIFIFSDDLFYLAMGRFVLGMGSGVGFLCIVKVIKTYFKPQYHPILIGCSFSFGLIGAVFGVTPMKIFFDYFGYNTTFYLLIFICFIIACLMLCFGKNRGYLRQQEDNITISNVSALLINPVVLIVGISGGLMVGSLEGFADVWALPFFRQAFNMNEVDSNIATSFVYFGMCVGGPVLALASNILRSINFTVFATGLLTVVIFAVLFSLESISFPFAIFLMFLLGILCCYQSLVFTGVSNYVKSSQTGLAIAITNCLNMSFGYFFHIIIARILQLNWDGMYSLSGVPVYSKIGFTYALSIIPVCCLLGVFGFLIVSYCYNTPKQKALK